MANFEWTHKYALGIDELDAHHRTLVELAKQLAQALGEDDSAHTLSILDELAAQTRAHFADEEQHMEKTGYPALAAHRGHHERLLATLQQQRERIERDPGSAGELTQILEEWLFNHMLGADKQYADYTSRGGAGSSQ